MESDGSWHDSVPLPAVGAVSAIASLACNSGGVHATKAPCGTRVGFRPAVGASGCRFLITPVTPPFRINP